MAEQQTQPRYGDILVTRFKKEIQIHCSKKIFSLGIALALRKAYFVKRNIGLLNQPFALVPALYSVFFFLHFK